LRVSSGKGTGVAVAVAVGTEVGTTVSIGWNVAAAVRVGAAVAMGVQPESTRLARNIKVKMDLKIHDRFIVTLRV
jgi:hypothetical protein